MILIRHNAFGMFDETVRVVAGPNISKLKEMSKVERLLEVTHCGMEDWSIGWILRWDMINKEKCHLSTFVKYSFRTWNLTL